MNDSMDRLAPVLEAIVTLRGQRVMLDRDLASLYGTTTKRLNEQVKRNRSRFPDDFMFQLTADEKEELVAICDHLKPLRFSKTNPYAFTEHGAVMLACVLNTERAMQTSILVVRAFVAFRRLTASHAELSARLDALEKKFDGQFGIVFEAIRTLIEQPRPTRKPIGFHPPPND
jgi:hypothetical protein